MGNPGTPTPDKALFYYCLQQCSRCVKGYQPNQCSSRGFEVRRKFCTCRRQVRVVQQIACFVCLSGKHPSVCDCSGINNMWSRSQSVDCFTCLTMRWSKTKPELRFVDSISKSRNLVSLRESSLSYTLAENTRMPFLSLYLEHLCTCLS